MNAQDTPRSIFKLTAPVRFGVVGLGKLAGNVHIPGLQNAADGYITTICDVDTVRLREMQAKLSLDDAHCFTDYRDLINCPDVDAVDVYTSRTLYAGATCIWKSSLRLKMVLKPCINTTKQSRILS